MAGVILIGMGAAKLGRLIQFIPHPVTTGFTSGIAVVLATIQIKDLDTALSLAIMNRAREERRPPTGQMKTLSRK
jgi:MFS superfamily sulfate permease-like transporter